MTLHTNYSYARLSEEGAIAYVLSKNLVDPAQKYTCKEIGDGNLNLVFHIISTSSNDSIIVKQALPYAKVVGESWPLTLERAYIEASALEWQATFVPTHVPTVLHVDKELAITVLEDLSSLTILRSGFLVGETYPHLGEHLGVFLAHTLFHTSDYNLHPLEKKKKVKEFSNPELCKITEDLVFTDPFFDAATNDFELEIEEEVHRIWQNTALKLEVAKLKRKFLTETEALLHGDLHTGSVFVNTERTVVIDPEFAFYGPIGFDLGQIIANVVFSYVRNPAQTYYLDLLEEIWETYEREFRTLWSRSTQDPYRSIEGYLSYTLAKHLDDALGFAGCELIRRTIGLAHVADLETIERKKTRIHAKKVVLALGTNLLLSRNMMKTIQHVKELVRQEVHPLCQQL